MIVKFKKTLPDVPTPQYAKDGDAAMDLTAAQIISENETQITYGTGIALEIPQGYVGLVFPRSSVRTTGLVLSNSVGVIDSGYRGEIQVTFNITREYPRLYEVGERIAQIMIMPVPFVKLEQATELNQTERGSGGFGSTGL